MSRISKIFRPGVHKMAETGDDKHFGVTCDTCGTLGFGGIRYKCLRCFDYDLCHKCHDDNEKKRVMLKHHKNNHPMQAILTKNAMQVVYGGQIDENWPYLNHAFACPQCGKKGFSEQTLLSHFYGAHQTSSTQILCPLCMCLVKEPFSNMLSAYELPEHLTEDHEIELIIERNIPKKSAEKTDKLMNAPLAIVRPIQDNTDADGNLRMNLADKSVIKWISQLTGITERLTNLTQTDHQNTGLFKTRSVTSHAQDLLPIEFSPNNRKATKNNSEKLKLFRGFEAVKDSVKKEKVEDLEDKETHKFLCAGLKSDNETEWKRDPNQTQFVRELIADMVCSTTCMTGKM